MKLVKIWCRNIKNAANNHHFSAEVQQSSSCNWNWGQRLWNSVYVSVSKCNTCSWSFLFKGFLVFDAGFLIPDIDPRSTSELSSYDEVCNLEPQDTILNKSSLIWHDCLWFSEQELLWNLVIKPLVLPYVVISKVRLGKNETVGIQLFASSENAGDSQVIISGGSKNLRMCLSDVQTALKLQKTCSYGYVLTEWRHSNVNLRLDYSFQFQSSYWHFCRVLRHQDIDNQAALIRLMQIVW